MAVTLFDSAAEKPEKKKGAGYGVAPGKVLNNCDLANHGKVLVRIPALDQEVWARLSGPGAGSGAGLYYCPRIDDEVLLGYNENDPTDAFIIAGLWSTQDKPPASDPVTATTKRKLVTGVEAGVGHEVEFDDGPGQSITITTTSQQQVKLAPKSIEISATGGVAKVTINLTPPSVVIEAAAQIQLKTQGELTLLGKKITIGDDQTLMTSIQGKLVKIN
jgi:uncharacterized protein involved in type VI secretion and phage assembly